jgi:hypothetical protein
MFCLLLAGYLLGVLFDPEDGENTFLLNVSSYLPVLTRRVPEVKSLLITLASLCLHFTIMTRDGVSHMH